jgi:hypothetical protein
MRPKQRSASLRRLGILRQPTGARAMPNAHTLIARGRSDTRCLDSLCPRSPSPTEAVARPPIDRT